MKTENCVKLCGAEINRLSCSCVDYIFLSLTLFCEIWVFRAQKSQHIRIVKNYRRSKIQREWIYIIESKKHH